MKRLETQKNNRGITLICYFFYYCHHLLCIMAGEKHKKFKKWFYVYTRVDQSIGGDRLTGNFILE